MLRKGMVPQKILSQYGEKDTHKCKDDVKITNSMVDEKRN
jgi:hypothetical protein